MAPGIDPDHMILFLMNERAGTSGLNGTDSLMSDRSFTFTRIRKTSDGIPLALRSATTWDPASEGPASMSMVLPAGDWIRIESPWPTSRTETRRVPAVVPPMILVAAGVEVMKIGAEVSVVVICVVGVNVAVVGFIEEVQLAIRRPHSKRLRRTRDVRAESMFFHRRSSMLLCVL